MKRFIFKGNLGGLIDKISTRAKKYSRKQTNNKINFSIFIEN